MNKILSALIAGTVLAAAPVSAAEVLTNGNFETGSFTGWTTTGNVNIGSVPYFGLNSGTYGQYLAAFNGGNQAPNGTLSQSFHTVVGSTYSFSFDYGVTNGGNQSLIASVLDGTTSTLLASLLVSTSSQTPQTATISFGALSGSSIIRFTDVAGNDSFNQDIGIDNVSVSGAVPEPASWALMIGGFGLVGFAMRRRAKVAVRFA